MKKVIIFCTLYMLITNSYALNFRKDGDCLNISYLNAITEEISTTLGSSPDNKNIVKIAISNLQKYCLYNTKVLQTPSFLNHLLDVYFRYLDGFRTNNYYGPLYPESVNYRKQLDNIAEQNFENVNPEIVDNLYKTFTKKIYPKYIEFCKKIPQINNLLSKSSLNSQPKTNTTTFGQNYCYLLANLRLTQEVNLLNTLQYKIYYTNWDNETFKLFKSFASQWDKLLNLFIISLGDFYYLVNRFIKVTNANTK